MRSAWIFRRKPSRLKLLQFIIAIFVFVIIYNSYPTFEYFQRKMKLIRFHETLDFEDQHKLAKRKINDKNNGRQGLAGDAQAERLTGDRTKENRSLKDKMYNNNRKDEIRAIGTGENRDLPSTRSREMTSRYVTNIGCKEKRKLGSHYDATMLASEVSCIPHLMSEEACRFTKEVYKIDNKLHTCRVNSTKIYCYLKHGKRLEFACANINAYRYCKISWLNSKSGDIVAEKAVVNLSRLSIDLKLLAIITTAYKNNFLFLQCFPKIKREVAETQLIILPYSTVEKSISKRPGKLNINIVLLDSISRAHFHRSLPVVLQTFNEINSRYSKAEVLDFELFQSVHGHSAENFHAFFTGKLLPENMTATKKEYANVGVEKLYGKLKDLGYDTMYQDDLCWKYWWGTRMELGMAENWQALQRAIKKSRIDFTGREIRTCYNYPKSRKILCLINKFKDFAFIFFNSFLSL